MITRKPPCRDLCGMAELHPVDLGVREIAVEQHAPAAPRPVRARPAARRRNSRKTQDSGAGHRPSPIVRPAADIRRTAVRAGRACRAIAGACSPRRNGWSGWKRPGSSKLPTVRSRFSDPSSNSNVSGVPHVRAEAALRERRRAVAVGLALPDDVRPLHALERRRERRRWRAGTSGNGTDRRRRCRCRRGSGRGRIGSRRTRSCAIRHPRVLAPQPRLRKPQADGSSFI